MSIDTVDKKIFVSLTPQETFDKLIHVVNNQPSKWKFDITETDPPKLIRLYGGRGRKASKIISGAVTLGIGAALTHYTAPKRIVNIHIKDINAVTSVQILTEGSTSYIGDSKTSKFVNLIMNTLLEYETIPNQTTNQATNSPQDPIELLKIKFVNGEITKEEYEEKMKILGGN